MDTKHTLHWVILCVPTTVSHTLSKGSIWPTQSNWDKGVEIKLKVNLKVTLTSREVYGLFFCLESQFTRTAFDTERSLST